ncbi:MAG: LysR family transcriptional regulator [Lachnospiraceae bacterium]
MKQLVFFKKAAELEHITRAAEELDTTQPFLSKTISELEEELGVPLFDHVGRSIRLNSYGKMFYKRVCKGLQELEDGKRELQDVYVKSEMQVRIVTNSSLYLPEILSRFHTYYPHIQLKQASARRYRSIKMLQSNEVDFVICSPPLAEDKNFESQVLRHEICNIIYPKGHWLADRETVTLKELEQEAFITAPPGYAIRDQIDWHFECAGIVPNYMIESTDTYNIPNFVEQGLGIAFVPQFFLRNNKELEKQSIEVSEPRCAGEVTLTWKKDRYLNQSCQIFRDFIVKYFDS